ncbi:MAG: CZB domain-containing protein [Sulfuritalea sp.]|nr:CZB domain-containing protein [Sulfuritalea sp.]
MQAFDFDSAISWHRSWKMKFHIALDTIRDRDFDTQPIGDDTQCRLGQWLAGNAGELAGSKVVGELLKVHSEFHRQSQSIADDIRNGKIVQMGDRAIIEFGVLSDKIETLLKQLKEELSQT